MIHGVDTQVHSSIPSIVQVVRALWPQVVFEGGESPNEFEFFAYKNALAKQSWDSEGRTEENAQEMIHFISDRQDSKLFTVVCEGPVGAKIVQILGAS